MRQAGQNKLGYYPCDPEVAKRISGFFVWPESAVVLDPCCGCGEALKTFTPNGKTFGVELARNRAEVAGAVLDKVLYGGFEHTQISRGTFSACWLNPPYDDEIGGGKRCELSFLQKATTLLAPGGGMVFLAPLRELNSDRIGKFLSSYYERGTLFEYPDNDQAGYSHISVGIFVGLKRRKEVPVTTYWKPTEPLPDALPEPLPLPAGHEPRLWQRTGHTDEELAAMSDRMPLLASAHAGPLQIGRPLLPLKLGHIAMVHASGRLNGTIHDHVARAKLVKNFVTVKVETTTDSEGKEKERHIQREKVTLSIKCLARHNGTVAIHSFA